MPYTLHHNILTAEEYAYLWRYFLEIPYTAITGANMRCGKAFQGDNRRDREARRLVTLLQSTAVSTHLSFNDFVAIRYEDGSHYVDWHTDGGYYMQDGCAIGSLSFGATRPIEFRQVGSLEITTPLLHANSLLVMPSGFQEQYEHRVPKCVVEELRIGLVLFTHRVAG